MTHDQPAVRVLLARRGRHGRGVAASTHELLRAVATTAPDVVALTGGPAGMRAQPRSAALAADLGLLLLAGGAGSGGALLLGRARVQERAVSVLEMRSGGGWALADLTISQLQCRFAVLGASRATPRQIVAGGERIATASTVLATRLRGSLTRVDAGPVMPWLLIGPGRSVEEFGPNALRGAGTLGAVTSPGVTVRTLAEPALPTAMVLLGVSAPTV